MRVTYQHLGHGAAAFTSCMISFISVVMTEMFVIDLCHNPFPNKPLVFTCL